MSTDPMLQSAGNLSINTFTGDGTTTSWNINFAGGYLDTTNVKAYTKSPAGVITIVAISWVGPNTVGVTPAVPSGYTLTVYRDTPKTGPVVDFTDGAIINEINLDKLAKQSVFASAEMVDRFTIVADNAALALVKADQAITLASATIGGDFTKFARTDVINTWSAAQSFPVGSSIAGAAIATQNYVTTTLASYVTAASLATTLSAYSTTAQMTTAIGTAQGAAATDATTKDNALLAAIDPDWLYTLATR